MQLCALDLLLVVLDVLLLLVLFDLFAILVEPSQLEQSNDDAQRKWMMENGNHCGIKTRMIMIMIIDNHDNLIAFIISSNN